MKSSIFLLMIPLSLFCSMQDTQETTRQRRVSFSQDTKKYDGAFDQQALDDLDDESCAFVIPPELVSQGARRLQRARHYHDTRYAEKRGMMGLQALIQWNNERLKEICHEQNIAVDSFFNQDETK